MKKKNDLAEAGKAQMETVLQEAAITTGTAQDVIETAFKAGRIHAVAELAKVLSVQGFHALNDFLEAEGYKGFGFSNATEFLNSSFSPLTKNQFYDRKQLLLAEGREAFDLLNSLEIPVSKRKLLTQGEVKVSAVDGEIVIGDGKEDHRIAAAETKQIVAVLTEMTGTITKQKAQIERGEKQLKALKSKHREELEKVQASVVPIGSSPTGTPYDRALTTLLASFGEFIIEARKLPVAVCDDLSERAMSLLYAQFDQLREAFHLNQDEPEFDPQVVNLSKCDLDDYEDD